MEFASTINSNPELPINDFTISTIPGICSKSFRIVCISLVDIFPSMCFVNKFVISFAEIFLIEVILHAIYDNFYVI